MSRYLIGLCPKCSERTMGQLLDENRQHQTVECGSCSTTYQKQTPPTIQRKTQYPHISASLGEVVTSRDHENHLAKKAGLVPQDFLRVRKPKMKYPPRPR